jgi:hypothetical protein
MDIGTSDYDYDVSVYLKYPDFSTNPSRILIYIRSKD